MKLKYYSFFVLWGAILLTAFSCATQKKSQDTGANVIAYPAPPAPARIQYLTSFSNSKDVAKPQSSFSKFVAGEEGAISINKPYGVAIHDGKIYASDLVLNQIAILDLEKRTFDYLPTVGLGSLKSPLNIFAGKDDRIYIADGEREQVVVFEGDGTYVDAFGGDGEKYKPTDVYADDDKIFVCDLDGGYIQVYKKDNFEFLYRFPEAEAGDEEHLYSPTNIDVLGDGVYVSDMGDSKVKIFT
ncbi:MAG: hypothetical protein ACE5FF_16395, partial [Saprospiraceae bacterium]